MIDAESAPSRADFEIKMLDFRIAIEILSLLERPPVADGKNKSALRKQDGFLKYSPERPEPNPL
ncbi:hypothetical protein TGAM01_v203535 [Trichoderma gamsii]|uniref:Uncharacterized protein n=1 Tax=Trichoderma gamsii TaxID=398673 RepID=A0A2P4ZU04_9HYPO|nr:hypothetical protein TGAM01_v203535 [Trichoderma gamsii]PON27769.1 hypothetical protein TGAM01_v203535 [Trichoderma gamsii]